MTAAARDPRIRAFEAGDVPPGGFGHREHVLVAWTYLREEPLLAALARFTTALRRFAAARGAPEKYHETITWAYVLLIHERLERGDRGASWDDFAAANADLLTWSGATSILARYYRDDTLRSDLARRVYVMPDRPAPARVTSSGVERSSL